MDATEDLSARVLLKHILNTEPTRTPITRSVSKAQSTSKTRRSTRITGASNPLDIVRRSIKQKMRESITRKSLPATTQNKRNTAASLLCDEGDTPRHILKNILQTDPVKSPVAHEKAVSEEPQPASSSFTREFTRSELSVFDLPDLTIGNAASTGKGLKRKRPRRSLNVTAFEKRLKYGSDPVKSPVANEKAVSEETQLPSASSSFTRELSRSELSGFDLPDLTIGNAASTTKRLNRKRPRRSLNATAFEKRLKNGAENDKSGDDLSSLSLSSSASLTLKTPFVDVQTEKKGLQRRISNRRKISEDEFGAAVNRRQMEELSSFAQVSHGLGETAHSEGFTLGLSKLSEPDITTDIVNCNTALYAQSDAVASGVSIVATQDKPTLMASQLQRQITEIRQEEKSKLQMEKSIYTFPTEEGVMAGLRTSEYHLQVDNDTDASQQDDVNNTGVSQPKDISNTSTPEEDVAKSQTSTRLQTPDSDVENQLGTQEEDCFITAVTMSQSEEKQNKEESHSKNENLLDSQTEQDDRVDSQTEDVCANLHSDLQNIEANSQSEKDENMESQTEDEQDEEDGQQGSRQLERSLEHISKKAHRSESEFIMPITEGDWDHADATETGLCDKARTHSTMDPHSSLETRDCHSSQLQTEIPAAEPSSKQQKYASYILPQPDAEKQNSTIPQNVICEIKNSSNHSDSSHEEAPAQEPPELNVDEEEEDEEENEEFPCKTPAFVREKINFIRFDPVVSSSVLKNIQSSGTSNDSPAVRPKKLRQTKRGPAKKEPGLPKSYLMAVFKHFAKTKVSADVYLVLKEIMDKFFERLAIDLETYAHHAKRSTIEFEDALLLLKRQGHVNDKVPVEVLIEKYLRMDQRRLLIPIATSGNVVIPKKRR